MGASLQQPIFLSYSRIDTDAAHVLRLELEKSGFSVFRDEDSIHMGDRWLTRLQTALQGCSALVLLVGRNGIQHWIGAEVEIALTCSPSPHDHSRRFSIYPLMLPEGEIEHLPPYLGQFQALHWQPNQVLPIALLEALHDRAELLDSKVRIGGSPFLGLSVFQRKHAHLFFGRREETLKALTLMGDQQQANPEELKGKSTYFNRWVQIEGNSGSGKSSLVNAGMLPLIEHGGFWARTGFSHWRILGNMLPGENPLMMLAEQLARTFPKRDLLTWRETLNKEPNALSFALRCEKKDDTAFLLIIDQFEELFFFAEANQRYRLDTLLAFALQDPECPFFLISTMRIDYLERIELLPQLSNLYNTLCGRYLLKTISDAGLREIIEQPAALAGLDVAELTPAMLSDAEGEIGVLPLVENALCYLWRHRKENRLRADVYRANGGLFGLLEQQADALLQGMDHKSRKGALELFLRLTHIDDEGRCTRRRVALEEAFEIAGLGNLLRGQVVIDYLAGRHRQRKPILSIADGLRLIVISQQDHDDYGYVDLVHETLIQARREKDKTTGKLLGYWQTLYDYIEANRDRDSHRQQLRIQTEAWQQSRGLSRWWRLAGWQDLWQYRNLRPLKSSTESRFLSWSRLSMRGSVFLLALLVGFVGESYLWTQKYQLPLDYMIMQQRFRFGYDPLPELVSIAVPDGPFNIGDYDVKVLQQFSEASHRYFGIPNTEVNIDAPFTIGQTEVTYEQYDYYVWLQQRPGESGTSFPTTAKGGRGRQPVVNVSWYEANAYAKWLGERINKTCRLPTEAEWEYAARANTKTAYPWGNEIGQNQASCNGCGTPWDNKQSVPVASFQPNAFGLYDTSGNVWEWTCSRWQEKFNGDEQRCIDREEYEASRVVRGGSWGNNPVFVRSAARFDDRPGSRYDDVGFRVLCWSPIE